MHAGRKRYTESDEVSIRRIIINIIRLGLPVPDTYIKIFTVVQYMYIILLLYERKSYMRCDAIQNGRRKRRAPAVEDVTILKYIYIYTLYI